MLATATRTPTHSGAPTKGSASSEQSAIACSTPNQASAGPKIRYVTPLTASAGGHQDGFAPPEATPADTVAVRQCKASAAQQQERAEDRALRPEPDRIDADAG